MTTGKTIALTRWTFVDKELSLLFNMLSQLVIAFLPRSKCILISWLQSPSAVILEPPKIKSTTVSTVFSIYLPLSDGARCHDFSFWMLKVQVRVTQLCLTLCSPMDSYSPWNSPGHNIAVCILSFLQGIISIPGTEPRCPTLQADSLPAESQAGIKIAERNINNLRYADENTLMAESEEELKSLLIKVKEDS